MYAKPDSEYYPSLILGSSTLYLYGKRLADIWTSITILLEKLLLHRNHTAWLPQAMLIKNRQKQIRPTNEYKFIYKTWKGNGNFVVLTCSTIPLVEGELQVPKAKLPQAPTGSP